MAHRDLELVRAVLDGDEVAFARLRRQIDKVVRSCLGQVVATAPWLRQHEADLLAAFDLLLVEDGHRTLQRYAGRAALTTWIHVIALRFFRRQAGRIKARSFAPLEGEPDRVDPGPDAEALLAREGERASVRAATRALPAEDQLLLGLFYEQGMNASQVAKVLGITASGVRMRKARLLARLAEVLKS